MVAGVGFHFLKAQRSTGNLRVELAGSGAGEERAPLRVREDQDGSGRVLGVADADQAAGAMGPAQKALADAQARGEAPVWRLNNLRKKAMSS